MIVNGACLVPDDCVGYQPGEKMSECFFAPWFLSQCYFEAPAVIWQRDGNKVTKTYKPDYKRPSGLPNVPQRIWILTDTYDKKGYRLGVWPD
jgi:hypothetical protein